MAISTPRLIRRREKLLQLIEKFGAARLADDIETPRSHISALSKGNRGIGDVLAEKLDAYAREHWAKEPGWIDRDDDPEHAMPFRDLHGLEVQLVTLFRQLPNDDERQHALIDLNNRLNAATAPTPSVANPWAGARDRRKADLGHTPDRRGEVLYGANGRRELPASIAKLVRK